MLSSAQLIIIELGCLDICNRNMRKFVVKYNQMECSCKLTSCFGNKMYYFGLLAFRLYEHVVNNIYGNGRHKVLVDNTKALLTAR